MNAFSVPPNYVASLQENLTDDVLRSPIELAIGLRDD